MSDEVTTPKAPYAPVFPNIVGSLKSYLATKAKEIKFGLSNSVTQLPYATLNVVESRVLSETNPYLPDQMVLHECSVILKLYIDEENIPKYYDMIVNLLIGWANEMQYMGIQIQRRTLYPVREEIGGYTIDIQAMITYQDYSADTTYPIVSEDECKSCTEASIYPKLMRVDKVQVTVDKI